MRCLGYSGTLLGGRWGAMIFLRWWNTYYTWLAMISKSYISVHNTIFVSRLQITGHSQGLTALYVMHDQHPSLADSISLVSAMAPIAYNYHTRGMLRWCSQFLSDLPLWVTVSRLLPHILHNNVPVSAAKWVPGPIRHAGLSDLPVLPGTQHYSSTVLWLLIHSDRVRRLINFVDLELTLF